MKLYSSILGKSLTFACTKLRVDFHIRNIQNLKLDLRILIYPYLAALIFVNVLELDMQAQLCVHYQAWVHVSNS